jgi:murein DD-endopeptidase MepM/ murein hydrolase activator NlpD
MRRISVIMMVLFLLVPVTAQQPPPEAVVDAPQPVTTLTQDGVTLDLFFSQIPQARIGLMRVSGDSVAGARVRFMDRLSEFFYVETDDAYYGLLVINMDQTPRLYDFSVFVWHEDGTRTTIPAQVDVTLGGFLRFDFSIPSDRGYLLDPEVERLEMARLDSVFQTYTEERMWAEDGWQLPIQSVLTSSFGEFRVINGTVETRHTGWDLRAPTGTPVQAMGAGTVAFAGLLDIRGNHVVIDHGYGIFSGYSHLSQVHVTRGQSVSKGQIIGVSGNTGRSGGPHLHWEINIQGLWVDSVDFFAMWLP